LRIRQDFLIAQALMDKPFAERDDNYQPMLDMALARIRQLSAHEVGHTIGFTHNFAASTNGRASVMDYPHPTISITDGNIDFSNAYAFGIGAWDKVTVAYSYSEFNANTNEKDKLNRILNAANTAGLQFISDTDARPQGGAHAFAHLWDNGKSASEELENLMNVRAQAISNFSSDNIRDGEPYSVLEDVFVPLYFFHRFQVEAATKVVGGLDYNYAVKGGNQTIVEPINVKIQKEALEQILKTISAEALAIPKSTLKLFPPRAYGYSRTRESFSSKTGVAFDPMSAAVTASDMTLELLLNPQRANRIIQQKSMDDKQLGLDEVLNEVLEASFGNVHKDSYKKEIQELINERVLLHLMNLAVSDDSFFQVKAKANEALNSFLSDYFHAKKPSYVAQYDMMVKQFKEHPEKFKIENAPKIPDGSPIGSGFCNYNDN
jgi:hypothetical protein